MYRLCLQILHSQEKEKGNDLVRIEFAGFSLKYRHVTNATYEGRQINRKVTFEIIEK